MRAQEVFNVETSENNGGLLPLIYCNTPGPHIIASNGRDKNIFHKIRPLLPAHSLKVASTLKKLSHFDCQTAIDVLRDFLARKEAKLSLN